MDEGMERDEALHATLNELASAAEVWVAHLTQLAETLQAMQAQLPPGELETWALATAGLDPATLANFLAFDGTLNSVTDRMLAHMQRVASGIN